MVTKALNEFLARWLVGSGTASAPPSTDRFEEAVDRAARSAVQRTHDYLRRIRITPAHLAGHTVLEICSNSDRVPALVLCGFGANVTVVDPGAEEWNADFHPAFHDRVCERIRKTHPDWPVDALERVRSSGTFDDGPFELVRASIENCDSLPAAHFELTISEGVFEHVVDVAAATCNLYRITRPGGLGIHAIDFRDHRDLSRPLEYCTISRADLATINRNAAPLNDRGNALRYGEFARLLQHAGFEFTSFEPSLWADDDYLADVADRLHPNNQFPDTEWLRVLSGLFRVGRRVSTRVSAA